MRTTSIPSSILKNPSSFVYAKVTIDGVDLTSRVIGPIELSTDINSKGWECVITFNNAPSLPDLRPDSGSIYTNTLKPRKEVKVELRGTLTKGDRAGTYDLVFDGLTGDEVISSRSYDKDDTVTIRCRGRRQKLLSDTFILDERIYPQGARGSQVWLVGNPNVSAVAKTVAQQILDEYIGGVTLYGSGPTYNIYPYRVREISVWDAIQNVFLPTGYEVREQFYSGTSRFEIVVSDPLAGGGSDTLTNYRATSLNYTDANIRNKVRIYWYTRDKAADIAAGAQVPPEGYDGVLYLERSDSASIAAYGTRAMLVREDKTSAIDTYAEAYALAGYILSDLKDPLPEDKIEHKGALYYIEPYDAITLSGRQPGTIMVTAIKIAVYPGGYAETTLYGVRKTVRENQRWIELDSRTDDINDIGSDIYTGSDSEMPPAQVVNVTATPRFEAVLVKWGDVTKYANGKPLTAKARYKVYVKRALAPSIPAIDISNPSTYDEIINVDNNEVLLKVSQELASTTTAQYIACVVTAVSRNGREGQKSAQVEARGIRNLGVGVDSSEANGLIHARDNLGNPTFVSESVKSLAEASPIVFLRARGTYSSPAAVSSGDELGSIAFSGLDTVSNWRDGAKIVVSVAGTVGNNILPARLGIYTRHYSESVDTEKFSIEPTGHVNIKPVTSSDGGGLEIWPYGTSAGNTGQLRLRELAANGTSVVGFKAPDSIASSIIWTLPAADGTGGQVLTTNGAGVLSWSTPGNISGSGTTGKIPKWSASTTLTDSIITESSGAIGIGTPSPAGILHIQGATPTVIIRASGASQDTLLKFQNSSASDLAALFCDDDAAAGSKYLRIQTGLAQGIHIETTLAHPILFSTNATERMRILSSGLIGVGVTTPTAFLHITGSTTAAASLRIGAGSTPTSPNDGDIWYNTELIFRKGTTSVGLLGWNKQAGNTVLLTVSSDVVGIGTTPASGVKVHILQNNVGEALRAESTATTGTNYGVRGSTASSSTGAAGVIGLATATSGTIYGVYGVADSSSSGRGVYGKSASGRGVYGETSTGYGVFGIATGASGFAGVFDGECSFSNGIVRLQGGLSFSVTSVTASYTVVSTDIVILVSASGGARTITLPAASARPGRVLWIIKNDSTSNAVTITRSGSDQIALPPSLVTSISTTTPYRGYMLVSGGSTIWYAGALT